MDIQIKKKVRLFIFVFGIMVITSILFILIQKKEGKSYYQKYRIKIKGVVISEQKLDHDLGLYLLNLRESNCKYHDLRNNNDDFLMVIKNNQAKILIGPASEINVGDTILVDYSLEKIQLYRAKDLIYTGSLPLYLGIGRGEYSNMFDL